MSAKQENVAFKTTSYFEVGDRDPYKVISPNFDGQGISVGPHQHNLGQGTLQPIFKELHEKHSGSLQAAFDQIGDTSGAMRNSFLDLLGIKKPKDAVAFVDKHWHLEGRRRKLRPEWVAFFKILGEMSSYHQVLREHSQWIANKAENLATWIAGGGPKTIRMYCLAYDIVTQNGGIGRGLRLALSAAKPFLGVYKKILMRRGKYDGREWLEVVAICRAAQTRIMGQKRFFLDVCARKLLIIDGEAKFRGTRVDVDEKFGVSDETY